MINLISTRMNLFLAALALSTSLVSFAAEACRDCPFPSPVSTMRWMMPSGNSEVVVDEVNISRGVVQSTVSLFDSITGDLLAIGSLHHAKGRKRISVAIFDKSGGKMTAKVVYLNSKRDKVQIQIVCDSCNVDAFYLN